MFQWPNGQPIGLKKLASEHLGLDIQDGTHDSVEDARVALRLYQRGKIVEIEERRRKTLLTQKPQRPRVRFNLPELR